MNWSNVKLILLREIRDQLRDQRTLFVIAVLPVMLYPLLCMSFLQVAHFMEEKPSKVLILGRLADLPPLLNSGPLARQLKLHFAEDEPRGQTPEASDPLAEARRAVERGEYDAAVWFPPDFAEQLATFRQAVPQQPGVPDGEDPEGQAEEEAEAVPPGVPMPKIIHTTATEKSQIANGRIHQMLERWRQHIVAEKLVAVGLPTAAAEPFALQDDDVARQTSRQGAAIWSKVLPVLLLVWAMTGAFYPAVDLCAGEKERGTLETLLCSPAERSEIVVGKLLTVMLFSMATAAWNLVMMGASGWLLLSKLPGVGPPPPTAIVWLAIVLVPLSALFSALSLTLAAFARSAKEGQYYFLPLLLVAMPLIVLPMAPGVELNLGNSLIPVSGAVLLLRSALEGKFFHAWPFVFPVAAVTGVCCLLAIRWAIEQFNSESVLFREGEQMDVGLWLRHLVRDRQPTPTVAAAVFCGVVILLIRYFLGLSMPQPDGSGGYSFGELTLLTVVTQLAAVAAPMLLMTLLLTSSPRKTLLLTFPARSALPALMVAVPLAVMIQPAVQALQLGVIHLYPPNEDNLKMFREIQEAMAAAPLWQVLLLLAVMPAVLEELAFRGFVLSGFRHLGNKWRAIFYSALFFGASHFILQQSISATLVGVLIGYLAVQSGSILPGMAFHMIHNGLTQVVARTSAHLTPELMERWPVLEHLVWRSQEGMLFRWPVVVASLLVSSALLIRLQLLPYPKSAEEERQEALRRASQQED